MKTLPTDATAPARSRLSKRAKIRFQRMALRLRGEASQWDTKSCAASAQIEPTSVTAKPVGEAHAQESATIA